MSVFVRPLQTFLKSGKNLSFLNYCKAHQYKRGVLASGHFVIQGRQNRAQKGDVKIDFKEELLQNL